ncbi:MAG: carboxypeptidase regulatory-like domain-containing protein [Acidobacteria bacterium]|nr:carboxypeptidase regulatory-like domain-containing protein [Acidobacteriota bacterium]
MRFFRVFSAVVAMVAMMLVMTMAAGAAAQSSRGSQRVTGKVLDEAGKPIVGAQVSAAKKGELKPDVFTATTNDKGEYSLNGLAAGDWVIEAKKKDGTGAAQVGASLMEGERTKNVDLTIAKPAPAAPDPSIEIGEEDKRAVGLAQADKFAEARKVYEDLLVKYPTVYGLHLRLATMYAAEKNPQKGLEHLKIALEKEPENVDFKVLQAELMMEADDAEGAKAVLNTVDITQIKDPRVLVNSAISDINSGKADEAIALLTKLIAQFPTDASLLYYRGRAYIVATKLPEAKADLEKFVAAAPTSPQAADAKRLLEQLTKK